MSLEKRRVWSFLLILAMVVSFVSVFAVAREVKAATRGAELELTDGTKPGLTVGVSSDYTWAIVVGSTSNYELKPSDGSATIATFTSNSYGVDKLTLTGDFTDSATNSDDTIMAGIIWESSKPLTIEINHVDAVAIKHGIYSEGPLSITTTDGHTSKLATGDGVGVLLDGSGNYGIYAEDNVDIFDDVTVTAGTVGGADSNSSFVSQGIYSAGNVSVGGGTLTANAAGANSTAIEAEVVSVIAGSLTVNAGWEERGTPYYGITGIKANTVNVNTGGTLTVNTNEEASNGIQNGSETHNINVTGGTLAVNAIGEHSNGTNYSNLTVNDGGVVTADATGDGSTAIRAETVTVNEGGMLTATATKSTKLTGNVTGIFANDAIILNGGEIEASAKDENNYERRAFAIAATDITLNAGTLTATAVDTPTETNYATAIYLFDEFNTTANIPCVSAKFNETHTNYTFFMKSGSGFVNDNDKKLKDEVGSKDYIQLILPNLTDDGKAAFLGANGLSLPTSGGDHVTVEETPTETMPTTHPVMWEGHVKGFASGTWSNTPVFETIKNFIGAGKTESNLTLYVQGYNKLQSPEGDLQVIKMGGPGVSYDTDTGWVTVEGISNMYGYYVITEYIPVTEIDITNASVQIEQNLTLSGTVVPDTATYKDIVWSISTANTLTGVSVTNGVFTSTTLGIAKVTATIANGTESGNFTKDFDITVTVKPVTAINITNTTVQEGQNLTLSGTVEPIDATNQNIVWSLKDANGTGATVTNGMFTATMPGTAKVTATITDGTTSGNFTKDFDITVTAIPTPGSVEDAKDAINAIPDISKIDPSDSTAKQQAKDMVDEAIKQVEALTDEQLDELKTQNPGILEKLEDAYRDINYLASGTLEIMDITIGVEASGTMPLDASGNPLPVKLEVSEIATPAELATEATKNFSGTPDIVLSFDVKLTADGKEIQPNGAIKVTFSAPGYEGKTLTVGHKKSSGEWEYFIVTVGADSSFSVTVTEFSPFIVLSNPELVPTGVSLSNTSVSLKPGEKTTITATVAPITAVGDIAWISSNPAVATVDANGVVTAISNGTATITMNIGNVSASAIVTVSTTVSPETGDSSNLALWMMIAFVGAVGIVTLMKKKFGK